MMWDDKKDAALCMREARIYSAIKKRDVGEVIGYAWEGVLDARRLYNPDKGASWETYAKFRIRGCIIDNLRKTVNWGGRRQKFFMYSLNYVVQNGYVEGPELAEFIALLEDDAANKREHLQEINEELEYIMAKAWLSKQERTIVRLAAKGYNLREIGLQLGLTESRISQIFTKIKKKSADYYNSRAKDKNYA